MRCGRDRGNLVLAAGAGELGVKVEGVADITDNEEWRAAFVGGQGGDVASALVWARSRALSQAGVPRWPWPVLVAVGLAISLRGGVGGESLVWFR